MTYLGYALRRLAGGVLTTAAASAVIYALISLAPGDPATQLAGPRATPEILAGTRHRYGLDKPLPVRYWDWITGAVHGDFGVSLQFHQSASSIIGPRVGITLLLVVYAFLVVCVLGIGLGVLPGWSRRTTSLVTFFSSVGIAVPSFVAALVLIDVFALTLGWFPVLGGGLDKGLRSALWHLTLPAVALAVSWAAYVAQISRANVLREADREHVEAARAHGVTNVKVFRRHILHNATPAIVNVSSLTLAGLLTGSVVIESVFGIGGLGSLLVSSVLAKDNNVVLAIVLVFVVSFVVATTLAELVQLAIDPRVATKGAR